VETYDPLPSRGKVLAMVYTVAAGIAIVVVALVLPLGGWVKEQIDIVFDHAPSDWLWPGVSGIAGLIIAVASLPMMFMRKFRRLYAVGVAWLSAGVLLGVFGLTRLVPVANGALGLLVQAGAFWLVAAVVWAARWLLRRGTAAQGESRDPADGEDVLFTRPVAPGALWWALCGGGLTLLPWAWAGAFGGFAETVFAALAAVGLALVASLVLGEHFWAPFAEVSSVRRIFGGGFAAGVALLVLGSAVSTGGLQLAAMLVAAALAFAIAGLQRGVRSGRITAAALAPALFGPLAFADADEFVPLAVGPEFGKWVMYGTLLAVIVAWIVGIVYSAASRRLTGLPAVGAGVAVVILAGVVGVNAYAQPGFHGEKVLVVMSEQANLSGVTGTRDQRLDEVHKRLLDTAASSQRSLRAELKSRGLSYRPFYVVNAIEVDTSPYSRSWLEDRKDVAEVLLNPRSRPVPSPEEPLSGGTRSSHSPTPNLRQIHAPQAWKSGRGKGVTIGIADSGVDGTHPSLAAHYRGGLDSWADPINHTKVPTDPEGHGTHVAGLAVGDDGVGVAPDANWMACANLPRNFGNPSDYLACMQFMLAPYQPGDDPWSGGNPSRAPDIVTNSWGCPRIEGCDAAVFGSALRAFDTAGVFFAVAAGNSGPRCGSASSPPAGDPDVYSVGSVDADNVVSSFSSRGPVTVDGHRMSKPDVSAPGEEVMSTLPGGGFGRLTGTSMATPQVAGAVAVLWSAHPSLKGDIAKTRKLLDDTASTVTKAHDAPLRQCGASAAGAGVVNVEAAVKAA
jgi:subtilisin family serine protease